MTPGKLVSASPLGRQVNYPDRIDPGLLFAIDRADTRTGLAAAIALPPFGEDRWTAWELSWLDARGKPVVAVGRLTLPASSPRLVESKSLKLYLNGFAQSRFDNAGAVAARLRTDLKGLCGATVKVELLSGDAIDGWPLQPLAGISLDGQAISIDHYGPVEPGLLVAGSGEVVEQTLVSRLFRSLCPVTGQPDWADIQIRYRGPRIDHAGLLRYLVSFRRHREFHEQCVERIHVDLQRRCRPQALMVHARFTRRGGLDINPWRATDADWAPEPTLRGSRQ
ncbi:MAG: NADPH-dependent 7-cyano-7-deazaguanine reductase QueF [Xanthomonadales bacterium]|nr:NADPH-dependent 7-cyano-7-deazaguanine reductase QueF [Xanthomonadales bacterium]